MRDPSRNRLSWKHHPNKWQVLNGFTTFTLTLKDNHNGSLRTGVGTWEIDNDDHKGRKSFSRCITDGGIDENSSLALPLTTILICTRKAKCSLNNFA